MTIATGDNLWLDNFYILPTRLEHFTDGLEAYYPFNGNANDESGNGNNGTVNGATLTTDRNGSAGKAYNFDGVNDYIQSANLIPNYETASFTAWIKTSVIPSDPDGTVVSKPRGSGLTGFIIGVANTSSPLATRGGAKTAFNNNSVNLANRSPNKVNDGQWHQMVGTVGDGQLKLYLDGQLVKESTFTPNGISRSQIIQIGREFSSGGFRYVNSVIEVT